ncbi:MAG: hypothetical protein LBU46_00330 [Candidatus Accumulibacter sp.]|jgi:hypothetical protein|nr:hypothetical protein [Accumulibacter sp.]
MKIRQKQVAAALAAVDLYLRQEEADAAARAAQETAAHRVADEPGAWAQAGRLDAMSLRRLMQMRAFASAR